MKIAIIGTGAMGSVYAARFVEAGLDVVAIDPWEAHIDAINSKGLRLNGPDGDRVVQGLVATTDPKQAQGADLIIIATKASGVAAAAQSVCPFVGPETTVLTIQNGLGAGERICEFLPEANVLLGVADGFGASMQGPGHVTHTAMKLIRLGEVTGGLTPRLSQIEALWQRAGFTAKAFDDIHQLIWEKLLCNVTLSAPCTVFDCSVGVLLETPERWSVALDCMQEAYACAKASEIDFSFEDPVAYVTAFAKAVGNASPSMRLDHLARRSSEIDFINGAVPPIGRHLNVPTPVNDRLVAEVRKREAKFTKETL
ncbi:2-dehydropantoate 2-reductase [Pseudophaeobacter sp.]|uniref:ketopantoate reductase family protein n=1 Tax=Pseudophaeobacter sp. TaxID=1971739 RepID=UPI00329A64A1